MFGLDMFMGGGGGFGMESSAESGDISIGDTRFGSVATGGMGAFSVGAGSQASGGGGGAGGGNNWPLIIIAGAALLLMGLSFLRRS